MKPRLHSRMLLGLCREGFLHFGNSHNDGEVTEARKNATGCRVHCQSNSTRQPTNSAIFRIHYFLSCGYYTDIREI